MQAGRKNKAKAVQQRRAIISRLFLEGVTGQEIAQHVGISESQVSRDLKAISKAWQESALQDISEKKARDLAELDHIKHELWQGWKTSKQEKADSRFIAELLKTMKQVSELLGYHADTKLNINFEQLTEQQIDQLLLKLSENG